MEAAFKIEGAHICPLCGCDLVSGNDIYGRPRICSKCVVDRVRTMAAKAERERDCYKRPASRQVRVIAFVSALFWFALWLAWEAWKL